MGTSLWQRSNFRRLSQLYWDLTPPVIFFADVFPGVPALPNASREHGHANPAVDLARRESQSA